MFAEKNKYIGLAGLVCLISMGLASSGICKTTEGEDENDHLSPPPTPISADRYRKMNQADQEKSVKTLKTAKKEKSEVSSATSPAAQVRAGDNISVYYFTKAGFVITQPSQLPSLGKVVGDLSETNASGPGVLSYSQAKKPYIEYSSKAELNIDDLLVVYSISPENINEPESNFSGFLVENRAIVKVISVQKKYCQVEIVKSFVAFHAGDRVRPYSDELQRWTKAQTKKPLPSNEIHCYVCGGEVQKTAYSQSDFIILTAGTNKGVVEGQVFHLKQLVKNVELREDLHAFRGSARVFFAGSNYSMAQILSSNESIQKGFEAVYNP